MSDETKLFKRLYVIAAILGVLWAEIEIGYEHSVLTATQRSAIYTLQACWRKEPRLVIHSMHKLMFGYVKDPQ